MVQPVCVFTVLTVRKHGLQAKIPLSKGAVCQRHTAPGRSGTETFSMIFYCVCEGTETLRKMMKYEGESICYLLLD